MKEEDIQIMNEAIIKVTAEICKSKEAASKFLIDAGIYEMVIDGQTNEQISLLKKKDS